jgi:hypothetical protein
MERVEGAVAFITDWHGVAVRKTDRGGRALTLGAWAMATSSSSATSCGVQTLRQFTFFGAVAISKGGRVRPIHILTRQAARLQQRWKSLERPGGSA